MHAADRPQAASPNCAIASDEKRFHPICFVVDRSALGHQAAGEFSTTKIVSGRAFADIFGLKKLEDITPDSETKVHICTIQGLVKRVLYTADDSEAPPIDQYDLIVVDECHRGYLLDREMSDAELSFRGQEDYISKYRRVLEYFDAVKVGLTATPALHTTEIFGESIFTYSYRDAVVEGHLIDHEPPIRIETALAKAGIAFEKDEQLELLNTKTGEVNLAHAPDEMRFDVDKFNKQVITPEFNRVVAEELAKQIDPSFGKTLIFAATDAHADIVLSAEFEENGSRIKCNLNRPTISLASPPDSRQSVPSANDGNQLLRTAPDGGRIYSKHPMVGRCSISDGAVLLNSNLQHLSSKRFQQCRAVMGLLHVR